MGKIKNNMCLKTEQINLSKDDYAIPYKEVTRLIEIMEYGSGHRVAIELIALTGCRISEISNFHSESFFKDNIVIWKPGKNQKGNRKEILPDWFLDELDYYWDNVREMRGTQLFRFNANSLNRYINKKIRPKLGGLWTQKRPRQRGELFGLEYILQIKGLRHNFQTLDFANNLDKWGKDVAIEFTSKRMKHSSYKMTARHYIQNFESLDIQRFKGMTMAGILKLGRQRRLGEFSV